MLTKVNIVCNVHATLAGMNAPATLVTPRDQRLMEGVIRHLPLFSGLDAPQLAALGKHCWVMHAARGETLARRDTRLAGVFAVAYGSVKLALRGPDNEERVLRIVSAGQSFGEPHALLGRASDYEALALSECKVVVMPAQTIVELAERSPRMGRNLMMLLAQRWVDLLGAFQAATMRRGAQRLASYLESLAGSKANGNGTPGPLVVALPVSKTMVAGQLGVKKETLSRLLRQFETRGLIEVSRREIAILDRQGLLDTAGESAAPN